MRNHCFIEIIFASHCHKAYAIRLYHKLKIDDKKSFNWSLLLRKFSIFFVIIKIKETSVVEKGIQLFHDVNKFGVGD